jgi:hypothetical protein
MVSLNAFRFPLTILTNLTVSFIDSNMGSPSIKENHDIVLKPIKAFKPKCLLDLDMGSKLNTKEGSANKKIKKTRKARTRDAVEIKVDATTSGKQSRPKLADMKLKSISTRTPLLLETDVCPFSLKSKFESSPSPRRRPGKARSYSKGIQLAREQARARTMAALSVRKSIGSACA